MTQPARRFDLWRRLYNRFLIEPFPAESAGPAVSTTVQPVTDADALLRVPTIQNATGDLEVAGGAHVAYFTVPAGKRWNLIWALRGATTGSSQVTIAIAPAEMTLFGVGTVVAAQSIVGVRLDEGDSVGMAATNNAADGAITLQVLYEEEDAF